MHCVMTLLYSLILELDLHRQPSVFVVHLRRFAGEQFDKCSCTSRITTSLSPKRKSVASLMLV